MTAVALPPRGGAVLYEELAATCRADGEWHLVGQDLARSTAWHIQSGRYAAFRPAYAFEAKARNTRGHRADIYVRFLGKVARA